MKRFLLWFGGLVLCALFSSEGLAASLADSQHLGNRDAVSISLVQPVVGLVSVESADISEMLITSASISLATNRTLDSKFLGAKVPLISFKLYGVFSGGGINPELATFLGLGRSGGPPLYPYVPFDPDGFRKEPYQLLLSQELISTFITVGGESSPPLEEPSFQQAGFDPLLLGVFMLSAIFVAWWQRKHPLEGEMVMCVEATHVPIGFLGPYLGYGEIQTFKRGFGPLSALDVAILATKMENESSKKGRPPATELEADLHQNFLRGFRSTKMDPEFSRTLFERYVNTYPLERDLIQNAWNEVNPS